MRVRQCEAMFAAEHIKRVRVSERVAMREAEHTSECTSVRP